ncbi:MAG: flagellar biosynthesis protein FliQ [Rhodospirillaceae bacterium]|nr:flagellar biosynthesis protein FliQ [Rhodospirillaceae bacterium]MEA4836715.1 flagellar biosynthesis protein FliQ [Rhodospirillaceae bacterium]
MNEALVLELARDTIMVLLKIGAPVLLAGLVVGLIISLFQALTQIQEATLTFVPKVLVVFMALFLVLPFMLHNLMDFFRMLMEHAASGG